MIQYSDNGVDLAMEHELPDFGYAVDVGASNGVFNSNTLGYEEKGWLVLCIEANPLLAEEGRSRRKLWREVACGAQDGEDEFWMHGTRPWASGSALSSGGQGVPYGGEPVPQEQRITVPVRTLDRLVEEAGFPRVDYLCIDVEGSEAEVLAGFTMERWKPKIVVVEGYPESKLTPPTGYSFMERRLYDDLWKRDE